ncbi:MAG TPA: hypothetical protein VND89_11375 [Acidimicrobiales bacterium]|nr:hypothetical protein [Acidimicrobiales bacterium]
MQLLEPAPKTRTSLHVAAIATYLVIALVLWAHVWFGGNPAHLITCNCGDTTEQVWWLEWLPWALTHGHNPLLTNAIWARLGGVNALSNTSWFAPAAVLSPITLLLGPVASSNVANLLAPVLSGWAAFALAGRFSQRTTIRVIAGGLYAFSPFVVRNTVLGHIDLTLTAYLPLVLLLGLELLSRGARPRRVGVLLGLLTILQFFTGLEVLAISAITGALCALGVVITRPRLVMLARRQLLIAASIGTTIAGVVLAYPLWFFLAGPRHVKGPFWPMGTTKPWRIIDPGHHIFTSNTSFSTVGYLGAKGSGPAFLGFGLLLLVALSFPLWRKRLSSIIIAGVAVASWYVEFSPENLRAKLPFFSSVETVRFALPVTLCVGLLLASSVDGWWSAVAKWWPSTSDVRRRRTGHVVIALLVVAAFVPTIDTYSVPFRVTAAEVPAWYRLNASRLAPGTAVLTLPFAYGVKSQPMAWQAESNIDFNLIGGWAFVPGANGVNDEIVSHLKGSVQALHSLSRWPDCATVVEETVIRAALLTWRPVVVVEVPHLAKPGTRRAMSAALGLTPRLTNGAWVWSLSRSTQLGALVPLTPRSTCRTSQSSNN